MADTGWVSPGTIVNADRDGKTTWFDPSYAGASDNNYAYNNVTKYTYGDWLRASNFGFSIPSGATINGIECRIERHASAVNAIADSALYLHKGGTPSGDDKASATMYPSSDPNDYVYYGGPTDTWNSGYSETDINDSTFGVELSCFNSTSASKTAYVDHMQLKIYYTEGGGGGAADEIIKKFNENLNGMINNGLN